MGRDWTIPQLPQVTRSQKAKFWLDVQSLTPSNSRQVTGKLYVTVPLLQATGLHPGQTVKVTGAPYLPKPATNPGAFDFKASLRDEGCFAGLRGSQVAIVTAADGWGWWRVQQQIVQAQVRSLGAPLGPLVSAMVLGSKGVDLSTAIKDDFSQVGLAHALAASGFQTSLILGVVLALTRRCPALMQVGIGTGSLALFVALSGGQPSVLRAALMGVAGLVALLLKRKVQPLGSLLVVAVLLLIYNPLWIWDLGFQLSFLATMGLLVTVSPLTKWLDWLPSTIAPWFAVPISAYLWTLPLQLFAFGVVSPYSILVNVLSAPLISVLSLGGMLSAIASVVWSPAGSWLAGWLSLPAQALLLLVHTASHLPLNAYAVGSISAIVAIGLYGLIGLTWLQPWWRQRWWVALMLGVSLVVIPVWQARVNQFQITVLATSNQPILVLQAAGQAAIAQAEASFGNDANTMSLTLLPFLQKQGVNEVNWAIDLAAQPQNQWHLIGSRLPIRQHVALNEPLLRMGQTTLTVVQPEPAIATLHTPKQTWLWFGALDASQQATLLQAGALPPAQVLWWTGSRLLPELVERLKPEVAIASASRVNRDTANQLKALGTRLYTTGEQGAIQWTPQTGFQTTLDPSENLPSAL